MCSSGCKLTEFILASMMRLEINSLKSERDDDVALASGGIPAPACHPVSPACQEALLTCIQPTCFTHSSTVVCDSRCGISTCTSFTGLYSSSL